MCGIIGMFSYNDPERQWPDDHLEAMIKAISHRGPDDSGCYVEPGLFLGHTRLSIIDLTEAGHQPMSSSDGRYVISYNGEIYNFRELRRVLQEQGYKFRSNSDTEVLLSAWQEWGIEALDKLDGIFAFAIFDRRERTLFLVRDHLGVKPLFYSITGGQVVFASEPQAMFGKNNHFPEVEASDLDCYFTFNYLPAPRTGFKNTRQLQPGHMLVVNDKGADLRRYWKPEYCLNLKPWGREQIELFNELLSKTVIDQMVSDAPLGLFLSGGLDSYAVALAASSCASAVPTAFTLGFADAGFDESKAAAKYSEHLNIPGKITFFVWNETEIYETLGAMRELLADASCFPVYQLSRFARKSAKVILAGDGGDELLAGYDTYKAGEITPIIRRIPRRFLDVVNIMARFIPSDEHRYSMRMVIERLLMASEESDGRDHASFRRIFTKSMKKRLYQDDFYAEAERYDPIGEYAMNMEDVPKERSYLTARQHADIVFHLPSILAKVDRMSMANGLEVRVPLLGKQLVNFCINLPDNAKRYRGKGKRILREVVAPKAPVDALKRPKAGFLPPVDKWFRYPGPMANVFRDHIDRAKSNGLSWLKWNEVERLLSEHADGKVDAGFTLLSILQFINWQLKCKN